LSMEYISPEYQEQLEELAEVLVTPERFSGSVALAEVVELRLFSEDNAA
jgi:predicted transcriptional regulator